MTVHVKHLEPDDWLKIVPQAAQREAALVQTAETAEQIAATGYSFAVRRDDGALLACLGTHALFPGCHEGFAIFSPEAGPHLLAITRAARRHLASLLSAGVHRIEVTIDTDFAEGRRWAELLGFYCEGCAFDYFAPGRHAWVYGYTASEPAHV